MVIFFLLVGWDDNFGFVFWNNFDLYLDGVVLWLVIYLVYVVWFWRDDGVLWGFEIDKRGGYEIYKWIINIIMRLYIWNIF